MQYRTQCASQPLTDLSSRKRLMDAPTKSDAAAKRRSSGGQRPVACRPCAEVRVGPIQPLADLLREAWPEARRDPDKRRASDHHLRDPDNWISFSDLSNLLQACSARRAARTAAFGWKSVPSRFAGPARAANEEQPDVARCPSTWGAASHLHVRGALSLTLDLGDEFSALGYALFDGTLGAAEEILDGAIAMQFLLFENSAARSGSPP